MVKTVDTPQNDEPVDGNDALVDLDLFDAIFGEPSNEEIAQALRQAEADFQAGKYHPASKASDISKEDDEPWRPPTKQEILEGIRMGFMNVLAGDFLSCEEFFGQLKE